MAKMEYDIRVSVTKADILESLFEESPEDIMDFIIDLDDGVGDFDFTERLIHKLILSMMKDDENFIFNFLEKNFPDLIETQKKIVFSEKDFDL